MQIYIKRIESGGGSAYCLVDAHGEALPFQMSTVLRSESLEHPVFTVEFMAGNPGLQVIDERDD